jgi:hypothetical protein
LLILVGVGVVEERIDDALLAGEVSFAYHGESPDSLV